MPGTGTWKTLVRVHAGRAVLGIPVRLPADEAIPAEAVPPPRAREARPFTSDEEILQREQTDGVPAWPRTVAPLVVLFIALSFAAALAWGVARTGRRRGLEQPRTPRPAARAPAAPVARRGHATTRP